jgi:hypothetical protein
MLFKPECLAKQTLDAIPRDSTAMFASNRQSEAGMREFVLQRIHDEQPIGGGPACTKDATECGSTTQSHGTRKAESIDSHSRKTTIWSGATRSLSRGGRNCA